MRKPIYLRIRRVLKITKALFIDRHAHLDHRLKAEAPLKQTSSVFTQSKDCPLAR
jgi:hypothetical protein